jgi:predicted RNA-binding protein
MCESSAYLVQDGKEELILENVEELFNEGDKVKIINLFGDQKIVDAELKKISFVDNKIIFEKRDRPGG